MDRRELLKLAGLGALAALVPGSLSMGPKLVPMPRLHYKSTTYTMGYRISHEMIEDDLYGDLARASRHMAQDMRSQHFFVGDPRGLQHTA